MVAIIGAILGCIWLIGAVLMAGALLVRYVDFVSYYGLGSKWTLVKDLLILLWLSIVWPYTVRRVLFF